MSRFLRESLKPMAAYVPGEQPRIQNLIKLNTNESPFPPSPGVLEALSRDEAAKLRLYSDPTLTDLTQAIAARTGVNHDQVTAGNGSDELLALAFLAFGERGVAFPDITYGFYPVWAKLFGLTASVLPLKPDFSLDANDYLVQPGMAVIANPNAPTGMALPLVAIKRLLASNPDHLVLVDEAYVEFGAETAVPLIDEFDNLLIIRTYSKSHSLAGARLGYAIGNRALIADLEKIRYSFHPYNVNRLSILAGAAAMRDEQYYSDCRQKIMSERESLTGALCGMGFEVLPSKANFVYARHPALAGADYYARLRERGILVRHFDQPRTRDFVRITIGTQEQTARLIEATSEILKAGETL